MVRSSTVDRVGRGRGALGHPHRAFPAATGKPLAKLATIVGRTELDIRAESLKVNRLEATDQAVQSRLCPAREKRSSGSRPTSDPYRLLA